MDRQLINYLPPVLHDVPELKAIMAAEQPEVERLWAEQGDVLENQFLVSATEYGVKRWERILKIYPKDTDGLEMRRARVLAILRLKLPYTMRWLRQWLDDLCGAGHYELEIVAYTIALNIYAAAIPEAEKLTLDIIDMLQAIKPANMLLHTALTGERMPMQCYIGCALGRGYMVTRLPELASAPAFAVTERVSAAAGYSVPQTTLPDWEESI